MKNGIWLAPVLVALTGLLAVGLLFAGSSGNSGSSLITATGRLQTGVEAGCMILQADDGTQYLLLDWSNYPPPGTRVTVTGYFDNDIASYCMQGSGAIHVVSLSISEFTTPATVSYSTATATTATVINVSTVQSTTITGVSFVVSGYVYWVVENPQCNPQCGLPSFILTYLYIPPGTGCTGSMGCYPPPQSYRLLKIDGSLLQSAAPNGTYATVTGMLVTPSSWNCDSFYVPKVCMTGDTYVQNIAYPTSPQPTFESSTMTRTETITRYVPIPGFEPLSILIGLLLGVAVLSVTRQRSHQ